MKKKYVYRASLTTQIAVWIRERGRENKSQFPFLWFSHAFFLESLWWQLKSMATIKLQKWHSAQKNMVKNCNLLPAHLSRIASTRFSSHLCVELFLCLQFLAPQLHYTNWFSDVHNKRLRFNVLMLKFETETYLNASATRWIGLLWDENDRACSNELRKTVMVNMPTVCH